MGTEKSRSSMKREPCRKGEQGLEGTRVQEKTADTVGKHREDSLNETP